MYWPFSRLPSSGSSPPAGTGREPASPPGLSSSTTHLHACRDRKKSEKEAAKQRKIDEEREANETAARREQEAAQAAAEQAAVDRKARQFEKKAMQRQRSKLRSQCAGLVRGESTIWAGLYGGSWSQRQLNKLHPLGMACLT